MIFLAGTSSESESLVPSGSDLVECLYLSLFSSRLVDTVASTLQYLAVMWRGVIISSE